MDNHRRSPRQLSAADHIVAANLRRLRHERGVTQDTIATLLGLSYQQVQKYETGKNRIGLVRLAILADFYGIHIDEFLHGARLKAGQHAPPPIDDPEVMALCRKLAAITDPDLRQKARRILDTLVSHG